MEHTLLSFASITSWIQAALGFWEIAGPWIVASLLLVSLWDFWRTRKLLASATLVKKDPAGASSLLNAWLTRYPALLALAVLLDIYAIFCRDGNFVCVVLLGWLLVYFRALRFLASQGYADRMTVVSWTIVFTLLYLPTAVYTREFAQSAPIWNAVANLAISVVPLGLLFWILPGRPKLKPTWILLPILALPILPLALLGFAQRRTPVQAAEVFEYLTDPFHSGRFALKATWEQYAGFVQHWQAAGNSVPDLVGFREGSRQILQADLEANSFNALYALPLSSLGFFTQGDVVWLEPQMRGRAVELQSEKPYAFRFDDLAIRVALLAGSVDPAQADRWAERIAAAAAMANSYRGLGELLEGATTLELLGRSDLLAGFRSAVYDVLLATYVPSEDGKEASFAPSAGLVERDQDGVVIPHRATFVWLRATSDAVRAMGRWGAPKGIDMRKLEAYLEDNTRVYDHDPPSSYGAQALGALTELRTLPAYHAQVQNKRFARIGSALWGLRELLVALWMMLSSLILATTTKPAAPAQPTLA